MLLLAPKGHQRANRATMTRTKINPQQKAMPGGQGARWQGDSQASPNQSAGGDVGEGSGAVGAWEQGLLGSKLQTTEHLSG